MYCQYWLFVHKYVKSYSKIQPTTEQNPQTYSKVIMKYYYIHVSYMSHSHSLLRPVAKHMPMDTSAVKQLFVGRTGLVDEDRQIATTFKLSPTGIHKMSHQHPPSASQIRLDLYVPC